MFGNSVFITLVVIIIVSWNSESNDEFLGTLYAPILMAGTLIVVSLIQYLATWTGLNHHRLIRFKKDE